MLRGVKKRARGEGKKGYTLVELLVVMAMIGILSSVIMVGLGSSREKARDAIRAGDLKSLSQAVETYFSENFEFPAALDDGNEESVDDLKQYYSDRIIPHDPNPESHYQYAVLTNPKGYCLGALMEQESSGNDVDCGLTGVNYQIKGP